MQHLLTLTDADIFESPTPLEGEWQSRRAARAIVFNEHGEIYLLKMSVRNYHKLPGGGIDDGESNKQALQRELLEEIGCPAEIGQEVGEIVEFRNEWSLYQTSYCYLARQTGSLQPTALEESELQDGAETIVVKNIDEAIALLEADQPNNYDGKFIQPRDVRFLREVKVILG